MDANNFSSLDECIGEVEYTQKGHVIEVENVEEETADELNVEDIREEKHEEMNIDNENHVKSFEILKPHVGMTFDSEEEAYKYYNMYARLAGFSIRKHVAHKSKITGNIINSYFVCSKQGHKNTSRSIGKGFKQKREVRDNCQAHLYIGLRKDRKWEVRKFKEEHSHSLATPSKIDYLHRHKNISNTSKDAMVKLHRYGMGPSKIAKALNMSGDRFVIAQDCVDHLRAVRKSNFGAECLNVISYFQSKINDDPGFFHRWELDIDGTVMNFFWADGRSRDSYITFGDVVIFDTTYRTNNLRMPFAPFTGINHHRRSCLFGCALLTDETEETFTWLFEKWSECMSRKHPVCIITDQDIAMGNAIRKVFPNTKHIFCSWHIRKNAMIHLQDLYARDMFKDDYNKWLHQSTSENEFEEGWIFLKQQYNIPNGHWLEIMYNKRGQWISLYFKDLFTAGMSTTQRAESINAFFDGFVNSNTSLSNFVEQYDRAIQSHRGVEEREDFHTMNSKPAYIIKSPLEEYAGNVYTFNVFCKFQNEYAQGLKLYGHKILKDVDKSMYSVYPVHSVDERKNIVEFSPHQNISVKCSCKKFEQEGIFCCHILCVLHKKGVGVLPEEYVLRRWTINARYSNARTIYDKASCSKNFITPSQKLSWQSNLWKILEMGLISARHLQFGAPIIDDVIKKFRSFHIENAVVNASQQSSTEIPTSVEISTSQPSTSLIAIQTCDNVPMSTPTSINLQESVFTIRDPIFVKAKGRPRNIGRIKSSIEISLSQNNYKKRTCGKCGKKGHDKRKCPLKDIEEQHDKHNK